MEEIDSKEASDALHMLLHCSLKDTEFETQKEQFEIVNTYIKKLEKEVEKLTSARNWYFEHYTSEACTPEMLHKILRLDYIPKSVIEEKIKEYKQQLKKTEKEMNKNGFYDVTSYDYKKAEMYEYIIAVLQELLEKGNS